MSKIRLLFLCAVIATALAIYGCDSNDNSGGDFVYTGTATRNGAAPVQTNDVLVQVNVDQTVPGAQQVAYQAQSDRGVALLKLISRPASAQSENYTLPGATVRAYDQAGTAVASGVVGADGKVLFEDLPAGEYRFVVTTSSAAVILQGIGVSNSAVSAPVRIDVETTVATLIALELGNGSFDSNTYLNAVNTTRAGNSTSANSAVSFINSAFQSSTTFLSNNGQTISSPQLSRSINTAAATLPGGTGGLPGVQPTGGNTTTTTTSTGTDTGTTSGTTGGNTTTSGTTGGAATTGTTGGNTTPGGTTGGGSTTGTTGGGTTPGGTTGGGSTSGTTGGGTIPGGTTGSGTN